MAFAPKGIAALACVLGAGGVAHGASPKAPELYATRSTRTLLPRAPAHSPERPSASTLTRTPEPSAPLRVRADAPAGTRSWGLFAGGMTLFLGGYALDAGLTYGLGHASPGVSLVPLLGPLIQLRDDWSVVAPVSTGNPDVDQAANQRIRSVNQTVQTVASVVLAVDFAFQLAGLTMAIVGLVRRAPPPSSVAAPRLSFAITPGGGSLVVRF